MLCHSFLGSANLKEGCHWESKPGYEIGKSEKELTVKTVEECKQACLDETSFGCKSITFWTEEENNCRLQFADRYIKVLQENENSDYHEIVCENGENFSNRML